MKPVVRTRTFKVGMPKGLHGSLDAFLEQQRQLWNDSLEARIESYKFGVSLTYADQQKLLTSVRGISMEHSEMDLASQRTSLRRLDKAFQSFFRRVKSGGKPGFPRFKPKGRVKSFDVPQFKIHRKGVWNSVKVKGIGRFKFKGEVEGTPKLVRIIKSPCRVKIQVVSEIEKEIRKDTREPLGIDVGIKERVTLSNGFQSPKNVLDRNEIKKRQRKFSKSKKRSNGRRKKGLMLAKAWQRAKERELGKLHELTASLVKEQGAKFHVEDLKIGNMVGNHSLARSILEQQWGTFVQLLDYKAEEAGGWVRKVDPRNTSQQCSACGSMPKEKLTLSDRRYDCGHCGVSLDRDLNAARNILKRGLRTSNPAGNKPGRRGKEDGRSSLGGLQDAERSGRLAA